MDSAIQKKAEAKREEAAKHDRDAAESFERCDTDGFLSQWASGINAERKRMEADLIEAGGFGEIVCLIDESGEIVPARPIETRYGSRWAIFASAEDANSRSGEIISWISWSQAANGRKGFRSALCIRKAKIELRGANATSVRAVTIADDGMLFNPEAEVVEIMGGPDGTLAKQEQIDREREAEMSA